jgi:hypothetical protein
MGERAETARAKAAAKRDWERAQAAGLQSPGQIDRWEGLKRMSEPSSEATATARIAAGMAANEGKGREVPVKLTEDERMDAMIKRAEDDPAFEASLTPAQRITMGYRRRAVQRAQILLDSLNRGDGLENQ